MISVVENLNLTWTPTLTDWAYSDKIDLGSVLIGGHSRMKMYIRITNFTQLYQGIPNKAYVRCYISSNYEYGEIDRYSFTALWGWYTTTESVFSENPVSGYMRETVEPSLKVSVRGESNTPNGPLLPYISCLVSIGIYLRNE